MSAFLLLPSSQTAKLKLNNNLNFYIYTHFTRVNIFDFTVLTEANINISTIKDVKFRLNMINIIYIINKFDHNYLNNLQLDTKKDYFMSKLESVLFLA